MLTAYLFDKRRGKEIEGWAEGVGRLNKNQVLWIDLLDPSEAEERELRAALDLRDAEPLRLAGDVQAEIEAVRDAHPDLGGRRLDRARATRLARPSRSTASSARTSSSPPTSTKLAVIDDFRTLAEGGSELGALDAASFLATLFEWVVTSYSRAFDEVESQLEEFDVVGARQPRQRHRGADRTNWSRFARASAGCAEHSPRIAKSSSPSPTPSST